MITPHFGAAAFGRGTRYGAFTEQDSEYHNRILAVVFFCLATILSVANLHSH